MIVMEYRISTARTWWCWWLPLSPANHLYRATVSHDSHRAPASQERENRAAGAHLFRRTGISHFTNPDKFEQAQPRRL
jgi:hypothetical protein